MSARESFTYLNKKKNVTNTKERKTHFFSGTGCQQRINYCLLHARINVICFVKLSLGGEGGTCKSSAHRMKTARKLKCV